MTIPPVAINLCTERMTTFGNVHGGAFSHTAFTQTDVVHSGGTWGWRSGKQQGINTRNTKGSKTQNKEDGSGRKPEFGAATRHSPALDGRLGFSDKRLRGGAGGGVSSDGCGWPLGPCGCSGSDMAPRIVAETKAASDGDIR